MYPRLVMDRSKFDLLWNNHIDPIEKSLISFPLPTLEAFVSTQKAIQHNLEKKKNKKTTLIICVVVDRLSPQTPCLKMWT